MSATYMSVRASAAQQALRLWRNVMHIVMSPQPFTTSFESCANDASSETAMASTTMDVIQSGVQFKIWRQEHFMEYTDDAEAELDGFYTFTKLRQAYP